MRTHRRRTGHALALLLVLLITTIGQVRPASASIPEPDADPFYRPPAGYEAESPGTILRTRDVTVTGLGIPIPVNATQMLVRSTDAKGNPATVVSTLMVPQTDYAGRRPLLSYQPAIDSLGDQCNPSYTLRTGLEKELPLMTAGLLKGWAVVVTDYQGPRDAFGAGLMEGRGVLDGIRAATSLPSAGLSGTSTPVGLWGYSGGGLATSWAAQLQPSYAPELDITGVASGGTPADLEAAARTMFGGPASGLALAAVVGITREYPELLTLVNDRGHAMIERIGDMCVAEAAASFPFRRLEEFTNVADPLSQPVAQSVLITNRLGATAPSAPVHLYHSVFDELVPFRTVKELKARWCEGGATVQFKVDFLSEHTSLAVSGAPGAVAYLDARFRGVPALDSC